jgi:hypothetical protein
MSISSEGATTASQDEDCIWQPVLLRRRGGWQCYLFAGRYANEYIMVANSCRAMGNTFKYRPGLAVELFLVDNSNRREHGQKEFKETEMDYRGCSRAKVACSGEEASR